MVSLEQTFPCGDTIVMNLPDKRKQIRPTASWPILKLRAQLLARLRQFFTEGGFLEVETPLLSSEMVIERHLDPFRTTLAPDARQPEQGQALWLQTSPEACMKRLMASGAEAIYQVTRSFRNGEQGDQHNPEFTIVEWYRRDENMQEGIGRLSQLCETLLGSQPAAGTTYAEAFERCLNIDPHTASVEELRGAGQAQNLVPPEDLDSTDRDAWLNWLLATAVEPGLGSEVPEILYHYPASQAALAKILPGPPAVAQRFELYISGVELANGYYELTDSAELRERFETANAQRGEDGKPTLAMPERLLAAMEHGLPECTGVALGFDRLVMLAAGATSIDQVLTFPVDRA